MLTEHKLTLAILEAAEPFYFNNKLNAHVLPPGLEWKDEEPIYNISAMMFVNDYEKHYQSFLSWLERDPRTTMDNQGDLRLQTVAHHPGYTITRTIYVHLTAEDKKFLTSIGKLVTTNIPFQSAAC